MSKQSLFAALIVSLMIYSILDAMQVSMLVSGLTSINLLVALDTFIILSNEKGEDQDL